MYEAINTSTKEQRMLLKKGIAERGRERKNEHGSAVRCCAIIFFSMSS